MLFLLFRGFLPLSSPLDTAHRRKSPLCDIWQPITCGGIDRSNIAFRRQIVYFGNMDGCYVSPPTAAGLIHI
jgi:hypothetical protein